MIETRAEIWPRKTRAQIAAFQAAMVDQALGGLAAESKHAAALCADGMKLLLKKLSAVSDQPSAKTAPPPGP